MLRSVGFTRGPHRSAQVLGYLPGPSPRRRLCQTRGLSTVERKKPGKVTPYHAQPTACAFILALLSINLRGCLKTSWQKAPGSTALCPPPAEGKPPISGEVAVVGPSFSFLASPTWKRPKFDRFWIRKAAWGAPSIQCGSIRCIHTQHLPLGECSDGAGLRRKREGYSVLPDRHAFDEADSDANENGQTPIRSSDPFTAKPVYEPLGEVGWGPKGGLAPHTRLRRRPSNPLVLWAPDDVARADFFPTPLPSSGPGQTICKDDEDVVLDTPTALLSMLESSDHANAVGDGPPYTKGELIHEGEWTNSDSPAARGVGQDVIDLVTDVFAAQRDAIIEKRRRVLYEITHPSASDYTYGGKMVPPPPLSFGKITEEAVKLGNQLMVEQEYFLVNQSGTKVDQTPSLSASSFASFSASPMVEAGADNFGKPTPGRAEHPAATSRASPHRGRAREGNIFRDHRYFFEINELYQEIVLVGKACAGKSSLLNALLGQSVAKTSSIPNTTRAISFYQSVSPDALRAFHARNHHNLVKLPGGGLQLTFVDLPGFGIEGMSDRWRDAAIELTDAYFGVRRSVNTVLFCIDCDRGLTQTDLKYFQWLENVQGVFFPVLTKCDAVPHSRICAVMRQIYTLITAKRKKYQKVFPFIIPTSSRDGTNIEVLRGLITESSGMIPGDRLRELLHRKQTALMKEALLQESRRLEAAHNSGRPPCQTKNVEAFHRPNSPPIPLLPSRPTAKHTKDKGLGVEADSADHRVYRLSIPPPNSRPLGNPSSGLSAPKGDSDPQERRGGGYRRPSERDWRRGWPTPIRREATSYGAVRFRVHSGIGGVDSATIDLRYHPPSRAPTEASSLAFNEKPPTPQAESGRDAIPEEPIPANSPFSPTDSPYLPSTAILQSLMKPEASRVVGWPPGPAGSPLGAPPRSSTTPNGTFSESPTPSGAPPTPGKGPISHFLDRMEGFSAQTAIPRVKAGSPTKTKRGVKEEKWRRREARGYRPALMVQDADGRLSECRAGKRCGPALVHLKSKVNARQAEWRGERLKELLHQHRSEAPWGAVGALAQSIEAEKQNALMKGMRAKDRAAYWRDAGSLTNSFEKFEGEVTAAKYINEVRQARTLRSREQMHFNATAKINWRSMPPGLWKHYGKRDTYWPTPRVLGRENDESHTASYSTPVH
ncbi:unnamed protein product [Phytomonas sp. Hart1]|nr:unnamed protein product [Phytomonas sp. Hart1]|eukprot:CCW72131.1 unnamed protein product [Phytomonas sp. isolate Hart1]